MTYKKCLVCGSESKLLPKTVGSGFRVCRCVSCHFSWIDRDSIASVAEEPVYDNYQYNQNLEDQFRSMEGLYKSGFEKRLNGSAENMHEAAGNNKIHFLDVGCANGEYLRTARSLGIKNVFGVEIDKTAKKNASKYGTVVDNPAELNGVRFDIIQIKNVLSNIEEMDEFFGTYEMLLKRGGVMWLDVLNQDSLISILRNIIKPDFVKSGRYGPLRPPYVINGFTKTSIKKYAHKFGLEVQMLKTSHLGSQYVPYSPPGKLAQIIRSLSTYTGAGSMIVSDLRKPK